MAGRVGVRVYGLLLRLMPREYREAYGSESLADLTDLLDRAARLRGRTVTGTGARACIDLLVRVPGEWWAAWRFGRTEGERAWIHEPLGMGERMMNVLRELRQAARTLARRPGFSIVAMTTLALGIGANVGMFSVIDAVLLRPLPYPDSEDIVDFRHHAPGIDLAELRNSEGMFAFYAERVDFFESVAPFGNGSANLTGGDEAVRVRILFATPELFDVLRTQPMIGRPFSPDDVVVGATRVGILTHGIWLERFGADPSVVGRTIELDGNVAEVVGVMPAGFAFPDNRADVILPMRVNPQGAFGNFGVSVVARLGPGMTAELAEARMNEVLPLLPEFFPDLDAGFLENSGFNVTVATLRERTVAGVESTLWIILGAVAFVLLIACANVANLFLVRSESRQKEMAVRAALGAGRRSVAASFLSESMLLGLGGGVLGVVLASGGVRWLLVTTELPRASEIAVGPAALTFALLLSLAAGALFGAIPLSRYAGRRFAAILRDGGRGNTDGPGRHRARNVLVASQLALGLVLLVGSGLMLRSFAALRAVDIGIEPEGILTLALNRNDGEDPEVAARFYQDVADRISALPGVRMVGVTTHLPLASGSSNGGSFYIESKPRDEGALPPVALYRSVGASYFRSLGIPVLRGRDVERADWEEPRRVVWVNEQFEQTYLDGDAIGQRIAWDQGSDGEGEGTPWAEVVGVVGDVREFGLNDSDLRPNAYLPLRVDGTADVENDTGYLTIKAADGVDPRSLIGGAEGVIRELDPLVPITATRTMGDIVDEAMEGTSITMTVLAVATVMALFLGAIGLAGVIAYVVGQRTREIGVRVALGANPRDVSSMIVRQSMVVVAGGTVLGLIGAFALTRSLEALLFEVSATDPLTFATAPVLLVAVSLLATWLPVRRATRVSPTEALRAE